MKKYINETERSVVTPLLYLSDSQRQDNQCKIKTKTKTERVLMWIVLWHSTKNAVTKKYNEQVGKQNYDQLLKWHLLFKLK